MTIKPILTISMIYLTCGNIQPDTRILIYDNSRNYIYNENPIYDGLYENCPSEILDAEIVRFALCGGNMLDVQVAI